MKTPNKKTTNKKTPANKKAPEPTLLLGGNPQIAKADGDAPVQAYIAAMPGWKRAVGRRLDAIVVRQASDRGGGFGCRVGAPRGGSNLFA